ncbi:TetR family transcriptional regulator C-terminal domain-containing protein [Phyllobacterium sp. 22552]|uniref:TetR family transcriptional regulator C-terminal domain-containing protein n=1 Tax=Phyllobacterium sp. 22552 TaxID=3453941 RepID=UPI003F87AD63
MSLWFWPLYPFERRRRLFANEILQGAEHLSIAARDHMRTVTSEKARVIDAWAAAGKIEKIDARARNSRRSFGRFLPVVAKSNINKGDN